MKFEIIPYEEDLQSYTAKRQWVSRKHPYFLDAVEKHKHHQAKQKPEKSDSPQLLLGCFYASDMIPDTIGNYSEKVLSQRTDIDMQIINAKNEMNNRN